MGKKHESHSRVDLSGQTCTGECPIHREPCGVVMRYNNPVLQETLDRLREVTRVNGRQAVAHDHKTPGDHHYCELCARAKREGRERDFYVRHPDGVVRSKHALLRF